MLSCSVQWPGWSLCSIFYISRPFPSTLISAFTNKWNGLHWPKKYYGSGKTILRHADSIKMEITDVIYIFKEFDTRFKDRMWSQIYRMNHWYKVLPNVANHLKQTQKSNNTHFTFILQPKDFRFWTPARLRRIFLNTFKSKSTFIKVWEFLDKDVNVSKNTVQRYKIIQYNTKVCRKVSFQNLHKNGLTQEQSGFFWWNRVSNFLATLSLFLATPHNISYECLFHKYNSFSW